MVPASAEIAAAPPEGVTVPPPRAMTRDDTALYASVDADSPSAVATAKESDVVPGGTW